MLKPCWVHVGPPWGAFGVISFTVRMPIQFYITAKPTWVTHIFSIMVMLMHQQHRQHHLHRHYLHHSQIVLIQSILLVTNSSCLVMTEEAQQLPWHRWRPKQSNPTRRPNMSLFRSRMAQQVVYKQHTMFGGCGGHAGPSWPYLCASLNPMLVFVRPQMVHQVYITNIHNL
jgi:hypothetical protein